MSNTRRLIPWILLLVLVTLPAAGQMKSMRTIVNAAPKPATVTVTQTPSAETPSEVTQTPINRTETTTPTGEKVITETTPTATTTTVQTDTATTTTTITPAGTTMTIADADPCKNVKIEDDLYGKFLPTKGNTKNAECFFGQKGFEVLKNTQLVTSDGSVAAAMETMSDFYRGIRFSLNVAVASKPEEEEDEPTPESLEEETPPDPATKQSALSLFQANGGNLALAATLPLYANGWGSDENGTSGFAALTYLRLAGTFDAFGDTGGASTNLEWDKVNANAEWAVTTVSNLVTINKTFQFELYTNAGLIAGSKSFRTSLGTTDNAGLLLHGEIGANFQLGSAMVIGVSYNYYSADEIEGGASLTVGFTRQ